MPILFVNGIIMMNKLTTVLFLALSSSSVFANDSSQIYLGLGAGIGAYGDESEVIEHFQREENQDAIDSDISGDFYFVDQYFIGYQLDSVYSLEAGYVSTNSSELFIEFWDKVEVEQNAIRFSGNMNLSPDNRLGLLVRAGLTIAETKMNSHRDDVYSKDGLGVMAGIGVNFLNKSTHNVLRVDFDYYKQPVHQITTLTLNYAYKF